MKGINIHHTARPIRQMAPMGYRTRISSESAWPLRGADGKTFAERAALKGGVND